MEDEKTGRGSTMLMTGLSGNEIYCLAQIGYGPGNIVVGNSVHSLGLVRGITSGLKTLAGGEIKSITDLIVDGRHAAINRLEQEAQEEQRKDSRVSRPSCGSLAT